MRLGKARSNASQSRSKSLLVYLARKNVISGAFSFTSGQGPHPVVAYRNVGDLPKPQLPIMAFIGRYPSWVGESLSPMVTGQRFASTQLDRWGSQFDLLFSEWKEETR
jgi:hypothetical protein